MDEGLTARLQEIAAQHTVGALGVAVHDYASGAGYTCNADRWFHAASTIKAAILVTIAAAADDGRFHLSSRLAVRNRFLSAADGEPYQIAASRDANSTVHGHIGRTLPVGELARHMIVTSSNLATNLLLDLVGADVARAVVSRLGIDGVDVRRGVEDERAFAAGINNRVTPRGLLDLFRAIHEGRAASSTRTTWMLEILGDQQFASGIPAGLPDDVREGARIAHKTGEISTAAHDAGVVRLADGTAYAVAILSEYEGGATPQTRAIADASRAVYERVMAWRQGAEPGTSRGGRTPGQTPVQVL
jgi:beta-lactamase class A